MSVKIKKVISYWLWVISFGIFLTHNSSPITHNYCYAAPCYGTKMPHKKEFFGGFQTHNIFKRYLENEHGKLRSVQHFFLLSYGIYDWLSIDLKGGAGNIKQHPIGNDEVDYTSNFAGGYGLRLKLCDKQNFPAKAGSRPRREKMVFGFQHISIHPKSLHLGDVKHQGILDDWQTSFLVSRDFGKLTPYLGTRWSRLDYIHWIKGERKRTMSDATKSIGLIVGLDIPIGEKFWLNLEGQLFDSEACALSVNFNF